MLIGPVDLQCQPAPLHHTVVVSTQTYFRGSVLQWVKKLKKRKKSFSLPTERSKLTQRQGSYYAIPIHDPKMGLGLKIVKNLSPSGLTPYLGSRNNGPGPPWVLASLVTQPCTATVWIFVWGNIGHQSCHSTQPTTWTWVLVYIYWYSIRLENTEWPTTKMWPPNTVQYRIF